MPEKTDLENAKKIFDILIAGATVMIGEHFFSTFLPSPATVETLYKTPEEKDVVKRYFAGATLCTLGFGAIMSVVTRELWPFLTSNFLVGIYGIAYSKTLETSETSPSTRR
jgi:hypothetical protein